MDEYIKREAVLALVKPDAPEDEKAVVTIATAKKLVRSIIQRAPAADVAPVRHGRWLCGDYYDIGDVCSECDWDSQMIHPSYRYCPNCGARMDGGDNSATD